MSGPNLINLIVSAHRQKMHQHMTSFLPINEAQVISRFMERIPASFP